MNLTLLGPQAEVIIEVMARRGTIAKINPSRGMVAISTEDDGYTIIELLSDWEIEVGDLIAWDHGHALGSEVYQNLSRRSRAGVYVQNHSVHYSQLDQQLLL